MICIHCNSSKLIPYQGFQVCKECGTAQEKVYDLTPFQEGRSGKKLSRTGTLGSEIGFFRQRRFTSHTNQELPPQKVNLFRRLRDCYHIPAKNATTQTHLRTFIIFNKVASQLEIPNSIRERTSYLYWKYTRQFYGKITNHVLLIALCLFFAIKESSLPISYQELIKGFKGHRVTSKNLLRLALDLGIPLSKTPVRKSEDYVARIVSTLRQRLQFHIKNHYALSPSEYAILLEKITMYALERLPNRGGVRPFPFAVTMIYQADRALARFLRRRQLLTQKRISCLTQAREYTIRDHCYKLAPLIQQALQGVDAVIREVLCR